MNKKELRPSRTASVSDQKNVAHKPCGPSFENYVKQGWFRFQILQ